MLLKSSKGQMAIFFIFIFQVLFILFAMTLNVALVVHDKINLQNSLDLAALYGAKKQAEVLNAMAHINYQMRQNYKLLAWRYRILGSVGLQDQSAYRHPEAWCPSNEGNSCVSQKCPNPPSIYPNGFCDAFFVCANVPIWARGKGPNQSDYCKNQNRIVPSIPNAQVVAAHLPHNIKRKKEYEIERENIKNICEEETALSWLIAHIFLAHFRVDQADRKIMMQALYDKSLKVGKDLDGKFIHEGAFKVFKKNLNFTNLSNHQDPIVFNSFEGKSFSEFLKPLNIFPLLFYLKVDKNCSGDRLSLLSNQIYDNGKTQIISASSFKQKSYKDFYNSFKELFTLSQNVFTDPRSYLNVLTLGYKKNPSPNLSLYYGLKVELTDSLTQLFLPYPSEPPVMKASSFAKPFGGRIGPDENQDPILKPQIDITTAGSSEIQLNNNLQPNYSRYPGDRWGLMDKSLHGNRENNGYFLPTAFLRKMHSPVTQEETNESNTPYDFTFFDHLNIADRADPLSMTKNKSKFHFLRIMELMAIFPDVFDITHYSISNNYMEYYFPKICKLIGVNQSECRPSVKEAIDFPSTPIGYIRGDFGYPDSSDYLQKNLETTKIANSFVPFFFAKNKSSPVDFSTLSNPKQGMDYSNPNIRYPYLVSDPAHFLTAWTPTTNKERYNNYNFPSQMFAKCYSPASHSAVNQLRPIPSGCAQGGRSGYSVKTISCNFVKTLRPQPPNLSEYCP